MTGPSPVDPTGLSTEAHRTLGVIHYQSNPVQGQWVSERQIKQILCAYGPLDQDDVDDGLDELEDDAGLIQEGDQGYRQAPGIGRPKHPGEV